MTVVPILLVTANASPAAQQVGGAGSNEDTFDGVLAEAVSMQGNDEHRSSHSDPGTGQSGNYVDSEATSREVGSESDHMLGAPIPIDTGVQSTPAKSEVVDPIDVAAVIEPGYWDLDADISADEAISSADVNAAEESVEQGVQTVGRTATLVTTEPESVDHASTGEKQVPPVMPLAVDGHTGEDSEAPQSSTQISATNGLLSQAGPETDTEEPETPQSSGGLKDTAPSQSVGAGQTHQVDGDGSLDPNGLGVASGRRDVSPGQQDGGQGTPPGDERNASQLSRKGVPNVEATAYSPDAAKLDIHRAIQAGEMPAASSEGRRQPLPQTATHPMSSEGQAATAKGEGQHSPTERSAAPLQAVAQADASEFGNVQVIGRSTADGPLVGRQATEARSATEKAAAPVPNTEQPAAGMMNESTEDLDLIGRSKTAGRGTERVPVTGSEPALAHAARRDVRQSRSTYVPMQDRFTQALTLGDSGKQVPGQDKAPIAQTEVKTAMDRLAGHAGQQEPTSLTVDEEETATQQSESQLDTTETVVSRSQRQHRVGARSLSSAEPVATNSPTSTSPLVGGPVQTSTAADVRVNTPGSADNVQVNRAPDVPTSNPVGRTEWVTLRLDDVNGEAARVRVAVRGDMVRTTILHPDEAVVETLRAHLPDLQQALAREGVAGSRVGVQTTAVGPSTVAQGSGGAPSGNADGGGSSQNNTDKGERDHLNHRDRDDAPGERRDSNSRRRPRRENER